MGRWLLNTYQRRQEMKKLNFIALGALIAASAVGTQILFAQEAAVKTRTEIEAEGGRVADPNDTHFDHERQKAWVTNQESPKDHTITTTTTEPETTTEVTTTTTNP
jgi:hypothetical protein